jgi:hypothetical protein
MSDETSRKGDERSTESGALDSSWAERLKRLAKANAAAHRARLRALTVESALREFEQLCREVHALYDVEQDEAPRTHPVGLIKLYRQYRHS